MKYVLIYIYIYIYTCICIYVYVYILGHVYVYMTDDINKTENELTTLLEKKTYEEVKQTIDKNQNTRDRSLRQRKQKKVQPAKV